MNLPKSKDEKNQAKTSNDNTGQSSTNQNSFLSLKELDGPMNCYDLNESEFFDIDDFDDEEFTNDDRNGPSSEVSAPLVNQGNEKESKEVEKKTKKKSSYRKSKTRLTEDGKDFRDMFDYRLEKDHRKIPKPVVKMLFNLVCEDLHFPKMSREDERSINKFFNNYARFKIEIINAIVKYIEKHPEIRNVIDNSIKKSNEKNE